MRGVLDPLTRLVVICPCWHESHIGEKTVATYGPESIAKTNLEQWTKYPDYHPL